MEAKIASIATSLRDRMRFYKLKVTGNAAQMATSFNEQFQPERVEDDRKQRRDWILKPTRADDVLVGIRVGFRGLAIICWYNDNIFASRPSYFPILSSLDT